MIGRLSGSLLEKKPPQILIDVQGVGYDVSASMNTIYQLPELGAMVTLHTHFVVREDAQLLYGFHSEEERALFRLLIKVNGVGPKLAITILSSIEPQQFVRCVHAQDTLSLVKLPGIGKKTAERLVVEMRDRLKNWQQATVTMSPNGIDAPSQLIARPSATQDAVSALEALGYKPLEASKAIARVNSDDMSSEQLIREALKQLTA